MRHRHRSPLRRTSLARFGRCLDSDIEKSSPFGDSGTNKEMVRRLKTAELPTRRLAQMLAEQKATVGNASTARYDYGPMP